MSRLLFFMRELWNWNIMFNSISMHTSYHHITLKMWFLNWYWVMPKGDIGFISSGAFLQIEYQHKHGEEEQCFVMNVRIFFYGFWRQSILCHLWPYALWGLICITTWFYVFTESICPSACEDWELRNKLSRTLKFWLCNRNFFYYIPLQNFTAGS